MDSEPKIRNEITSENSWRCFSVSRGHREIILAFIGLVIVATSPPNDDEAASNSAVAEKVHQPISGKNMAATGNTAPASTRDAGCKRGHDDRNSDLCAQWKAADAAQDSVWWSGASFVLGLFGSLVGVGTLFAAGYAAFYAKTAAAKAAESNEIARDTAKRQLKAYVALDRIEIVPRRSGGVIKEYSFIAKWKNYGQTYAQRVKFHSSVLQWHAPHLPPWFPFFDIPKLYGPPNEKPKIIAPGQVVDGCSTSGLRPDLMHEILRGWMSVFCWGWIEYVDCFGEEHRTTYCHRIDVMRIGGDSSTDELISSPIDRFNCVDDECKFEEDNRPEIPEDHRNFVQSKGGDEVGWLMWLEDQAPTTLERWPDGTPHDQEGRNQFGIRAPRARY